MCGGQQEAQILSVLCAQSKNMEIGKKKKKEQLARLCRLKFFYQLKISTQLTKICELCGVNQADPTCFAIFTCQLQVTFIFILQGRETLTQ